MILPEDTLALQYYDSLQLRCSDWKHNCQHGTKDLQLLALQDMIQCVHEDEEAVCIITSLSAIITHLMTSDEVIDEVRDLADTLFEMCVTFCPSGVEFPSRSSSQRRAIFFLALSGSMSLRAHRTLGSSKAIPHIVWHSSIVLARWLQRESTVRWAQGLTDVNFGNALELGGGTCIPGLALAAVLPSWWTITLSDVDIHALKNAAYNAKRHRRLGYSSTSLRVTTELLDWNNDEDFYSKNANSFDLIIGADIIHENWMADGVWRAITRYLKPNGIAIIVNPSPKSREGADRFQSILASQRDSQEWDISVTRVTNLSLRAEIVDETEDIPLDFYTISMRCARAMVGAIHDHQSLHIDI